MKMTDAQAAGAMFVHANPGATVEQIARAAGVSAYGSDAAEFVGRLIDSGLVQVVCTADVRAVLDNDADDNLDEPALALHDYMTAE